MYVSMYEGRLNNINVYNRIMYLQQLIRILSPID